MVIKRKIKSKKPITAKPEKYFNLVTGVPLKNLSELASALEFMNGWVFDHHVGKDKNDFAKWVSDVLQEEDLASDLQDTKDVKDMEIKILRHLVNKYV